MNETKKDSEGILNLKLILMGVALNADKIFLHPENKKDDPLKNTKI